jgi:hypothetical protein
MHACFKAGCYTKMRGQTDKLSPLKCPVLLSRFNGNYVLRTNPPIYIYPFKSVRYVYVPRVVTIRNSAFCLHSAFMCFVWSVAVKADFYTNRISWFVCVYVCMYFFIACSMYVCMYVRTYVRTYVCMYVCTYVRTYVRKCVCTYVCMYICMYVCMYVRTYVFMYVCTYVCMYVCM